MNGPTNLTIDDMVAALARSEADIDAGRIVPGETVVAELRASIARMEAKQPGEPHRESAAPR